MKKIDNIRPLDFEFAMTTNTAPRLVVLKVHGDKGQELSIPMAPAEAIKLAVALGGFSHAVRRAEAQVDANWEADLSDLSDLINGPAVKN